MSGRVSKRGFFSAGLGVVLLAGAALAQDAPIAECDATRCSHINVVGDPASTTLSFSGHADPALVADPVHAGRIWMAYTFLQGRPARGVNGRPVGVPTTSTHLAVSDDRGATWRLSGTLWSSDLVADPEGQGPASYFGSETPTLAVRRDEAGVTWFSVRLSYFLEPVTAYRPRYASGWVMRVAKAQGPTPAALANADDVALGVRTTAAAYGGQVDLNGLAPQLADCAMWNNPAIAVEGARVYVIAECLVFRGRRIDQERSRIVVVSAEWQGAPAQWRWRYDGVLADRAVAQALGGERLVSAAITRGRGDQLLFIATPQAGRGPFGQGCVVLALESLDPPRLRREAGGGPVIVARQTARGDRNWHTGACAYDAASETGVVTVAATTRRGLRAELRATGLRP
jgi:hypothetical protein